MYKRSLLQVRVPMDNPNFSGVFEDDGTVFDSELFFNERRRNRATVLYADTDSDDISFGDRKEEPAPIVKIDDSDAAFEALSLQVARIRLSDKKQKTTSSRKKYKTPNSGNRNRHRNRNETHNNGGGFKVSIKHLDFESDSSDLDQSSGIKRPFVQGYSARSNKKSKRMASPTKRESRGCHGSASSNRSQSFKAPEFTDEEELRYENNCTNDDDDGGNDTIGLNELIYGNVIGNMNENGNSRRESGISSINNQTKRRLSFQTVTNEDNGYGYGNGSDNNSMNQSNINFNNRIRLTPFASLRKKTQTIPHRHFAEIERNDLLDKRSNNLKNILIYDISDSDNSNNENEPRINNTGNTIIKDEEASVPLSYHKQLQKQHIKQEKKRQNRLNEMLEPLNNEMRYFGGEWKKNNNDYLNKLSQHNQEHENMRKTRQEQNGQLSSEMQQIYAMEQKQEQERQAREVEKQKQKQQEEEKKRQEHERQIALQQKQAKEREAEMKRQEQARIAQERKREQEEAEEKERRSQPYPNFKILKQEFDQRSVEFAKMKKMLDEYENDNKNEDEIDTIERKIRGAHVVLGATQKSIHSALKSITKLLQTFQRQPQRTFVYYELSKRIFVCFFVIKEILFSKKKKKLLLLLLFIIVFFV